MYWYGYVEACGSGLSQRGLNFSTAWCSTWLNSVEKDSKHVLKAERGHYEHLLWHCLPDIPVATDHNRFFSEPPTITHNWLFSSIKRLKERNRPSVRWKSFAIHKSVWWHFQVGWTRGLQIVFLWDNINNQKYVWIILLNMTFLDFLRYSATFDTEVDNV